MNEHGEGVTTNDAPELENSAKGRRGSKRLIVALIIPIVSLLSLFAVASPAQAWPWSANVTLTGSIQCPAWGGPFDRVTWAWLEGSNGDRGWLNRSGGGRVQSYNIGLSRVPSGGEYVTISYGCSASGQRSTSFGVSRPAVGLTAVRNIY